MSDVAFYEQFYTTAARNHWLRDLLRVSGILRARAVRRRVVAERHRLGRPLRILDYGCGRGRLSKRLADLGEVTGLDYSDAAVAQARALCPQGLFFTGSVLDGGWAEANAAAFDAVVCSEVIEHLAWGEQASLLDHVRLLTAPGGLAVVTTPMRERALTLKADPAQPDEDFLRAYEGQPTANLLTTRQLLGLTEGRFRVQETGEVTPLVRNKALDVFLKAASLPFGYLPLEFLTGACRRPGRYLVVALRPLPQP